MTDTHRELARWRSDEGRRAYYQAYDATLSLWPVPFESLMIATRFGDTHAIVSGPPDAPPLLLLHAAGLSATQWHPNAGDLSRDYRVHALDFIGDSGKGRQTVAILSPDDSARWLADVLDSLGLSDAHVVGSSQGGWFGLNLALRIPDRVRRLVLLAPAASLLPFRRAAEISIRLGPLLPFGFMAGISLTGLFGRRYQVPELFERQLAVGLEQFRYQQDAVFPSQLDDDQLRRVACPTLVLIGEHEMIYDPELALERARRLNADVEAELVPNAGHLLGMERSELVDQRVLAFLGHAQPEPRPR